MWIKICGLRDIETAERVAAFNPDAIGLNFFQPSPRSVDRAIAAEIVALLPSSIAAVGLFVNHDLADVLDTGDRCGLSCVQIHGDEPPEFLAAIRSERPGLKVLRAFRVDDSGCGAVAEYLAECRRMDATPAGCLIDARVDGAYGGTGHTAPWTLLAEQYDFATWPPLIVAGGLTPQNVAEAIRVTTPWGVDVASGVESQRGRKDLELVHQFVNAARSA